MLFPVFGDLLPDVNELFQWKAIFAPDSILAFNKTALLALVSTVICIAIFVVGMRRPALVPTGVQNAAEMGYSFVEDQIAVQVMGVEAGKRWAPFIGTLFFWIFFINIWEVIPFVQFPATSRIAIPLLMAAIVYVLFIVVGFIHQGAHYIPNAILPPGVPKLLLPLVALIEIFSKFFMRPFSLAIRLFANMVAGHVLLSVFAIMTNELIVKHDSSPIQIVLGVLPLIGLIALTGLELLVALLQAYIFSILTAVYLAESIHPEH
jgi:F-type H+-transporting ATPase subunit a